MSGGANRDLQYSIMRSEELTCTEYSSESARLILCHGDGMVDMRDFGFKMLYFNDL